MSLLWEGGVLVKICIPKTIATEVVSFHGNHLDSELRGIFRHLIYFPQGNLYVFFIRIKKRIGPKTDPCGIPCYTQLKS
jgi:hypothetical protein